MKYIVKEKNMERTILLKDILFFESSKHYLIVHLDERSLICREKISEKERELEKYQFIRIHIGDLVNMRFIEVIGKNSIILRDGTILEMSKYRAKEVQKKYRETYPKFL